MFCNPCVPSLCRTLKCYLYCTIPCEPCQSYPCQDPCKPSGTSARKERISDFPPNSSPSTAADLKDKKFGNNSGNKKVGKGKNARVVSSKEGEKKDGPGNNADNNKADGSGGNQKKADLKDTKFGNNSGNKIVGRGKNARVASSKGGEKKDGLGINADNNKADGSGGNQKKDKGNKEKKGGGTGLSDGTDVLKAYVKGVIGDAVSGKYGQRTGPEDADASGGTMRVENGPDDGSGGAYGVDTPRKRRLCKCHVSKSIRNPSPVSEERNMPNWKLKCYKCGSTKGITDDAASRVVYEFCKNIVYGPNVVSSKKGEKKDGLGNNNKADGSGGNQKKDKGSKEKKGTDELKACGKGVDGDAVKPGGSNNGPGGTSGPSGGPGEIYGVGDGPKRADGVGDDSSGTYGQRTGPKDADASGGAMRVENGPDDGSGGAYGVDTPRKPRLCKCHISKSVKNPSPVSDKRNMPNWKLKCYKCGLTKTITDDAASTAVYEFCKNIVYGPNAATFSPPSPRRNIPSSPRIPQGRNFLLATPLADPRLYTSHYN